MKVVCNFCDPPQVLSEVEPLSDLTEIPGICPTCYAQIAEEEGVPKVEIPKKLGKCDILKVHDDGEVLVKCGGKKFIVTPAGESFTEDLPIFLTLT
jgi:hypothetical protein